MFRYALTALAAIVLVCATLGPDDALARGGRGGRFHGGGAHRGGAVHAGHYHGVAGHPVARTAARRGVYRGAAYGAAAVGAAAAGAAYYGRYNNNGCYQDSYGSWVCPNQY
jgi:hypothetical protein